MAINKKASLKKTANSAGFCKVPFIIDKNTNKKIRLEKNKTNEYVLPDGTLYKKEIHGNYKIERRPIMQPEDLLDKTSFPLLARTLNLQKYQSIIQELRDAVKTTSSGIVNFVIGCETDVAEGILKSAFPPGSGIVYKGVEGDGYNINTANWDEQQAKGSLTRLIRGNAKGIDEDSINQMEDIHKQKKAVRQTGLSAVSPLVGLDPQSELSSWLTWEPPPPAQPGMPRYNPDEDRETMMMNQVQKYRAIIERIKQFKLGIAEAEKRIQAIEDPYDTEKTILDPNTKIYISQAQQYKAEQLTIKNNYDLIGQLQTMLPQERSFSGEPVYDGLGFVDYGNVGDIYKTLKSSTMTPMANTVPEIHAQYIKKIVLDSKEKIQQIRHEAKVRGVREPKQNDPASKNNILAICNQLDRFLSIVESHPENRAYINRLEGDFTRAVKALCEILKDNNSVLILNNVHGSPLVRATDHTGVAGSSDLQFVADDVLSDHFVKSTVRNNKKIILVSRQKIRSKAGVIRYVPSDPNAFLVDDDEGFELVKYHLEKCINKVIASIKEAEQKKAAGLLPEDFKIPSLASINVSKFDIKQIAQMLNAKTQVEADDFLGAVFKKAMNDETGAVSGIDLIKASRQLNNDSIRDDAKWTSTGGAVTPMFRKEAKLTWDEFIYSDRSDWGKKVEEIHTIVKTVGSKIGQQKKLMQQVSEKQSGLATEVGTTIEELDDEIDRLNSEIETDLHNGIKHFMILYGPPGCGKSAFPEALATQLGYDMLDVNFGETQGGLVGQTQQFTRALLEAIKKMSNVVIRLDELDGQFVGGGGGGTGASVDRSQMTMLLNFFQDHEELLMKRNIFFVATTNHLEKIDPALVNRSDTAEVPTPFDEEGYERFLDKAIRIMKRNMPVGLVYTYDKQDPWKDTERFWDSVTPHIPEMAKSLVGTGMNFRSLCNFISKMFASHRSRIESAKRSQLYSSDIEKYKEIYSSFCIVNPRTQEKTWPQPKLIGMPFTIKNFCEAAKRSHMIDAHGNKVEPTNDMGEFQQMKFGIDEYARVLNGEEDTSSLGPAQLSLPMDIPEENIEDTLMPVASTDYYYKHLVKAGFDKVIAKKTIEAQFKAKQKETYQMRINRIARGDIRDYDSIELDGIGIYPIPPSKNVKKQKV